MAANEPNGNGHAPEGANGPAAPEPSVIQVQFAGPGSAEFEFLTQNISPAQIYALKGWLDLYCLKVFQQVERAQAQAQPQIARPDLVIPRGRI